MEGGYPDVAVADEPTLPPTPASNQVAIDLTSGALGGAAGLLVGHPFDTVKVKMQNAPPGQPPVSAFAVARNTLRDQGLARGLYRGMAVPMGTVALFNAVLFATNGAMKRVVEKVTGRKPADFGVREYAMCGMGAGVAVSLVATPTELIKCRLQAPGPGVVYTGPMDVARQVWNARGLLGLYKGLFPTFYREIPGNMLYFAFYEGVKLSMLKEGQTTADLSQMQVLLAGGIGGLAFWGGVSMPPSSDKQKKFELSFTH